MSLSQAVAAADAARAGQTASTQEVLSFRLGSEEYGIDILKVQEIRSYEPPTRIAHAPAHMRGVINLRGVIVPVVDLRQRFGAPSAVIDGFTVVIVLHLGARTVGIVVDSVSDVLQIGSDDIRPAPQVNCTIDAAFITGLGSIAERTLILLDIQALLNSPDMGLVDLPLGAVH